VPATGSQSPGANLGAGFVSAGSDNEGKLGGSGGIGGSGGNIVINLTPSERDAIIKLYKFSQLGDVLKKLGEIKNERKNLRTQLDQFQKNFEETHKRKIRYTKDIVPV